MIKYIITLLVIFAGFLNGQSKAEVAVNQISENRSKKFEKKKNSFNFNNDSLVFKIDFKKSGLVGATKYKFEIESAKDSTGKALKVKGFKSDEFREINRKHMFFGMKDNEKDPNHLRLELTLDQSSRAAKSVSVKGDLLLMSGDQNAAFFKDVQSMSKKELKHNLLTKAGVKITVVKGSGTEIEMTISGKTDAIASLDLVDSKGEDASSGSSSSSFFGKTTRTLYIDNGKKGIMLKAMIISNMKEDKIPFSLNNVELP